MNVAPGTRLGPYEVVSRIGAGGMGEVWRARDTRLDRSVAVKVLLGEFLTDPQLKVRFDREARAISQLNHPNICTLHDVGEGYLVMELIDGESLAQRLARGPLPLAEVFKYGEQIAGALDRAHRAGIVHRDLKPGNVMLTKSGVKLLDFGLARINERSSTLGNDASTALKPITAEGTIVGTLQYMAPEQLQGEPTDARTDIFALGCILYEILTGRRAFEGSNQASIISAIMTAEPRSPSDLQPLTPRALERLIFKCLAKDPDERWQSAADVADELRWLASTESESGSAEAVQRSKAQVARWKLGAAVLALLLVALAGTLLWRGRSAGTITNAPAPLPRIVKLTWEEGLQSEPTISPDGSSFAYVARTNGNSDVYFRRVGGENAINLTKDFTGSDYEPSFSPDGQSIAFRSARDGGGIFLMGATGESVRRLTDFGEFPSWSPDGKSIVLSGGGASNTPGIWVVDVVSGARRKVFDGGFVSHPIWSPSGNRIAYLGPRERGLGMFSIWTIAASGGTPVKVCDIGIWENRFAWANGWVWYLAAEGGTNAIMRVRIDETTGAPSGTPDLVFRQIGGWHGPSVSADGQRILFDTNFMGVASLVRYGLDVARAHLSMEPKTILTGTRRFRQGVLSPDGEWLATMMQESSFGQIDLVLVRTSTGETRRLTNDDLVETYFLWAPDGSKVYFTTESDAKTDEVWSIHPDGSGRELEVSSPAANFWCQALSPDGHDLYVNVVTGDKTQYGRIDLRVPSAQRRVMPLALITKGRNFLPVAWSPDGRWILGSPVDDSGNVLPDVLLYDVAAKTYRTITVPNPTGVWYAVWLPDSRRAVLVKGTRETAEITLLDRETGKVTSTGTIRIKEQWMDASRDGHWIYSPSSVSDSSGNIWMLDSRTKQ